MLDVNKLIIRRIAKKPNLLILFSLKSGPKKWSDFEKLMNKKYVHQGLRELAELGLVKPVVIEDSPIGSKAYVLTDFGRFVLEKLEEIEKYNQQ
ncbi:MULTISPECIES: winged helix-turn-helix transcriptional regulator [unclassified Archaeoglobus]|uniref:winged helix-turn-helix transcriptional regulator n=1 Tax=unclassified Archaeoglobus TaxID=2643606 RepID=UPI0025C13B10|nr:MULTISPECIES: winged helix-turn-helix transcriptional regulator [unclassified Archaeoglobus]